MGLLRHFTPTPLLEMKTKPCLLTHLSRGLALMTLLAGTSLSAIGGEADATDSFQRCGQLGELSILSMTCPALIRSLPVL